MTDAVEQQTSQTETSSNVANVHFLNFDEKEALYRSYMPFITNGGFFIPTEKTYHLGDEISMLVKLPHESEHVSMSGVVVWVTPPAAQRGLVAGIGVQWVSENAQAIRGKVETLLAGALQSGRQTQTL